MKNILRGYDVMCGVSKDVVEEVSWSKSIICFFNMQANVNLIDTDQNSSTCVYKSANSNFNYITITHCQPVYETIIAIRSHAFRIAPGRY